MKPIYPGQQVFSWTPHMFASCTLRRVVEVIDV